MVGQEFERYLASQPDVFRAVDHAHASAAEMRDDSVMRDGTADHRFAGSIAQLDGNRGSAFAQNYCFGFVTCTVPNFSNDF
jgi:hypothetical protein